MTFSSASLTIRAFISERERQSITYSPEWYIWKLNWFLSLFPSFSLTLSDHRSNGCSSPGPRPALHVTMLQEISLDGGTAAEVARNNIEQSRLARTNLDTSFYCFRDVRGGVISRYVSLQRRALTHTHTCTV